ncbi:MAG: hypothetical protein GQF41_2077 [Candidatus Rifleibacterium amylolyticum]|nr:MAG: hypothetical protein GQF41_2077 [Candidatus Rifleibacterium amylolyticum]
MSGSEKSVNFRIRQAVPADYSALGKLTVEVYKQLPGMPSESEQREYYAMLGDVEGRATKDFTEILVAVNENQKVLGGVTYINDMRGYGSAEFNSNNMRASAIRLLAVSPEARGAGIGKALTGECIRRAVESGHTRVFLHTTKAMSVAWGMYERLGFRRQPEFDFMQGSLQVYGFILELDRKED